MEDWNILLTLFDAFFPSLAGLLLMKPQYSFKLNFFSQKIKQLPVKVMIILPVSNKMVLLLEFSDQQPKIYVFFWFRLDIFDRFFPLIFLKFLNNSMKDSHKLRQLSIFELKPPIVVLFLEDRTTLKIIIRKITLSCCIKQKMEGLIELIDDEGTVSKVQVMFCLKMLHNPFQTMTQAINCTIAVD